MLSIEQAIAIVEVGQEYSLRQENFMTLIDEYTMGRTPEDSEVIETAEKFLAARQKFENIVTTHGLVA